MGTYWGALLVIISICCSASHTDRYHQVVMRDIGNKILWSLGDSSSRVMPIVSEGKTHTIAFEHPVSISYDTLITIVSQELNRHDITRFVVELKDCQTDLVFLAFAFNSPSDSLVPCRGRDTPLGCYKIEITLGAETSGYRFIIPFAGAGVIGWFLLFFFKSKQVGKAENADKGEHNTTRLRLGRYHFDANGKALIIDETILPLTDNETKLLSLLIANLNQTVTREMLMAEIWGEAGLMVISRNIDVLVSKLRKKLKDDPAIAIANVHGVGYKLVEQQL